MSKALKCDRCGKCFELIEDDDNIRMHIPVYHIYNNVSTLNAKYMERAENVDFCPACTMSFQEWMKEMNNESKDIPEYDYWRETEHDGD